MLNKKRILILVVCCLLTLSACAKATEAPLTQATMDVLYTSVAQTLAVSMPTVTPTLMATATPTITMTLPVVNTVAPATPTQYVPVSACDDSLFLTDVTIPDNTAMTPGQAFTKTWSIKNVGTCNWSTSYKVAFLRGDAMGGTATAITAALTAGHADNLSVKLVAPITKGTYTGTWIMQNAAGQPFGASFTVVIVVSNSMTATVTGSVTPTPNMTATTDAINKAFAAATAFASITPATVAPTATSAATATTAPSETPTPTATIDPLAPIPTTATP